MIINDGELDRDTRKNVLSQEFTHLGIACGCHSVIGEVCCFAYGKDINDGNQSPSQPLYDVPKEQCNAQTSQGGDSDGNGGVYTNAAQGGSPYAPDLNNGDDLNRGGYMSAQNGQGGQGGQPGQGG